MPTGYTADIVNGKVTSFNDFVLKCARAFVWQMKEADWNDPLIEEIKLDPYYQEKFEAAQKALDEFDATSTEDALKQAQDEFAQSVDHHLEYVTNCEIENARIDNMLVKVDNWNPPEDLKDLKSFMHQQLIDSKHNFKYIVPPQLPQGSWLMSKRETLVENENYYRNELIQHRKYVEKANKWLKLLRESLNNERS